MPPLTALCTHNSISCSFRLLCNNVNLLRGKYREAFLIFSAGAKRMMAFFGRNHLVRNSINWFWYRIHSFQPNRQKGPWHWKGWEPLSQDITSEQEVYSGYSGVKNLEWSPRSIGSWLEFWNTRLKMKNRLTH